MISILHYGLNVQAQNWWLLRFPRESRDEQHVLIVLSQLPRNSHILDELVRYEGQNRFASHTKRGGAIGDVSSGE